MKRVIICEHSDIVELKGIPSNTPIFAKKENKLKGMLVKEDEGWILRMGGRAGSSGHHSTREACIKTDQGFDFTFFIED